MPAPTSTPWLLDEDQALQARLAHRVLDGSSGAAGERGYGVHHEAGASHVLPLPPRGTISDADFRPKAVFLAVLLVFADAVSVISWLCHGASKSVARERPKPFVTEYGRNFSVFMNDGQAARIDFMTTDAPNTTTNKSEKKRGYEEGGQKIELLRARWPKAFPAKSHEVRPLTNGAQQAMVEEFGWSPDYARAVLTVWKLRPAYCNAILRYPTRINLDGSASGEEIDDAARATATKRLEERAARQARKLAKLADAEQQRLRAAAKERSAMIRIVLASQWTRRQT